MVKDTTAPWYDTDICEQLFFQTKKKKNKLTAESKKVIYFHLSLWVKDSIFSL